ncbi:hypothetical protein M0R45_026425 [Rubus argutus]|uniref:Uncharacterized protein n=1 Tax=Rubus argutus TaxID=59490 RepID=A0AAW1X036_RUBAR
MELKLAATASAASSVLSHFSPRSSTVDHPLRSDSICRCQAHKPTGFPKSFPINSAHPRRRTSLLATPPLKFTEPCSHRDVDIASLDHVVFSLSPMSAPSSRSPLCRDLLHQSPTLCPCARLRPEPMPSHRNLTSSHQTRRFHREATPSAITASISICR